MQMGSENASGRLFDALFDVGGVNESAFQVFSLAGWERETLIQQKK